MVCFDAAKEQCMKRIHVSRTAGALAALCLCISATGTFSVEGEKEQYSLRQSARTVLSAKNGMRLESEPVALQSGTDNPQHGQVTDEGDSYRFVFNEDEAKNASLQVPDCENTLPAGTSLIQEDDENPEYTVEEDPRTVISDTTDYPYSAICKITMQFEDAEGEEYTMVGSGFMINANTVMTAGHCVYDHENNLGWAKNIWIEPGRNGEERPFGTLNTQKIAYIEADEKWIEAAPEDSDNALIVLNENIGDKTGVLPLSTDGTSASEIVLSGYPVKFDKKSNPGTMVTDTGSFLNLKSRCLESNVYGSGGQSGSPLMNEKGEVIATYAYSYVFENRTGGPLIDTERLQWIMAHEGNPAANLSSGDSSQSSSSDSSSARNTSHNSSESSSPDSSSSSNADSSSSQNPSKKEAPVYRLYNPNTGEHFYTMDEAERDALDQIGWKYEGVAWSSDPDDSALAVYRVYNPNSGDHHYTADQHEYDTLASLGWRKEGISWYSAPKNASGARAVYRIYNPNAKVGQHHFTQNEQEAKTLIRLGWKNENTAFYTLK